MTNQDQLENLLGQMSPELLDDQIAGVDGHPITSYPHVVQAVFCQPWAITEEYFAIICEVVAERARGFRPSAEEIQERLAVDRQRVPRGAARNGTIAVLPILGVMTQRANMMSAMSGGTSTELVGAAFQQAVNDPEISAIVLDVDSPGGRVHGTTELHHTILQGRGSKPIVAVANSVMASAAYWVSSAADEIVVTPGGEVGSIGIIGEHVDMSAKLEQEGVKVTLITAGKKKGQGHSAFALDEETKADMQARVNEAYQTFTGDVARARGVSIGEVRGGFGEGGMVGAQEAVRIGMADRVETFGQAIQRLQGSRPAAAPTGRKASVARRALAR